MTEITVGIDIGTTSVKALAVDAAGRVRARARVPHRLIVMAPDMLEHDAGEAWCEGPARALADLGGLTERARGVGICAMVPSVTAVDERLRPLSPGPLYGDRRGRSAARALTPLDSHEGRTLLRWAAEGWPDAHGYWPAQALATAVLGGEPSLDFFSAMSFYPVFDGVRWDPAVLADIGVREEQLPRVRAEPAAAVGRLGGAVLAAPGADVPAEQIVNTVDEPGEVFVVAGATLIVWAVTAAPVDVPGLWSFPHTRPGLTFAGGPSNAGGLFLDWARRVLAEAGGEPDPGRVPVWLPYVRGERVPVHDAALRASLHDLDLTHGPAELRRAAYEAAGFVVCC